jgi:hypothetical protein
LLDPKSTVGRFAARGAAPVGSSQPGSALPPYIPSAYIGRAARTTFDFFLDVRHRPQPKVINPTVDDSLKLAGKV